MSDKNEMGDQKAPGQVGCADAARRRLLTLAAYATPLVLTYGLPRSSEAAHSVRPPEDDDPQ